jgi:hypothetical protein
MNTIPQADEGTAMNRGLEQALDRGGLARFCARHRVHRLSLIHGDPLSARTPTGSYDVLVEFEPGASPSTFVLIGMEIELSELARRRVDLRTYDQLKHGTARRLLDGAKTIFVT